MFKGQKINIFYEIYTSLKCSFENNRMYCSCNHIIGNNNFKKFIFSLIIKSENSSITLNKITEVNYQNYFSKHLLMHQRTNYSVLVSKFAATHNLTEQLILRLFKKKIKIRSTFLLINNYSQNSNLKNNVLINIITILSNKVVQLPTFVIKVIRFIEYRFELENKNERKSSVKNLIPRLKKLIKKRIEELVKFIFPINEIQSTKSSSLTSDSQEDIKTKLAEATRTAYIRGRWIFTDSWGETQHSIVAPTLPDSGDYSPYIHWVSANKDNSIAMTSSSDVDHNPAYNISAALTYTTQLVDIIAHFLDIRLPNKLLYCEFCVKHLNERKFIKCVTHLNANILMLCLTQNVDPGLLQSSQTIRNLLLLLDTTHSDLGRLDPIDVDTSSVSYLEEQLTHQIHNIGNDDDDNEYDSDHLATDWEAVPLVPCPEAMPGSNLNRRNTINTNITQPNSIAGGLVTSAAASIASIWRGWSINK
ncbi:hypothetical protein PGB90_004152 [Kerria lacca]